MADRDLHEAVIVKTSTSSIVSMISKVLRSTETAKDVSPTAEQIATRVCCNGVVKCTNEKMNSGGVSLPLLL